MSGILHFVNMVVAPGGIESKESSCSTGDPGSVPRPGRSPGEGNGNLFQYSCLGNPMDEEPGGLVYGVTRVGPDLTTKPPPMSRNRT